MSHLRRRSRLSSAFLFQPLDLPLERFDALAQILAYLFHGVGQALLMLSLIHI